MLRIIDRLTDTPAMVVNSAGETLVQTPLAVALVGDDSAFSGLSRSIAYRWFTDADTRARFLPEDHALHARAHTARLREAVTRLGPESRAAEVADALLAESTEFAELWHRHDVSVTLTDIDKRIVHVSLGVIEVQCQTLFDPSSAQALLVYTAVPGSSDHEKLAMLAAFAD